MRVIFVLFFAVLELFCGELITAIKVIEFDENRANLGKKLFFDTRLSKDGSISCDSCHDLKISFSASSEAVVDGIGSTTLLNVANSYSFFHDGRFKTLKEQVGFTLLDANYMGESSQNLVKKVLANPEYADDFVRLYTGGVNYENIVDALVNFEKSLVTLNSKFDQFLLGDEQILTQNEKKGYEIFIKTGCVICHNGVNLGSNSLEQEFAKPTLKVPTLRNISKTAPYMYDGSQKELKGAIKLMANSKIIKNLSDEEIALIEEFLLTLDGKKPEILNEKQHNKRR